MEARVSLGGPVAPPLQQRTKHLFNQVSPSKALELTVRQPYDRTVAMASSEWSPEVHPLPDHSKCASAKRVVTPMSKQRPSPDQKTEARREALYRPHLGDCPRRFSAGSPGWRSCRPPVSPRRAAHVTDQCETEMSGEVALPSGTRSPWMGLVLPPARQDTKMPKNRHALDTGSRRGGYNVARTGPGSGFWLILVGHPSNEIEAKKLSRRPLAVIFTGTMQELTGGCQAA
jgi:hypothetical protein